MADTDRMPIQFVGWAIIAINSNMLHSAETAR